MTDDKIAGLTADLRCAVQVAWRRGAKDWARLNYPGWVEWLDGCSSNDGAGVECPACEGSGKIVEAATTTGANQHSACQHDCEDCDGSGRILPQTEKGS